MLWGDIEVMNIPMGRFWLDGGSIFGVVPKTIWSRYHQADSENRIEIALRSLLIKTGSRTILVDTGIGNNFNEKYRNIYKIDNERENPEISLRRAGCSPDDITDVIITHLHFDHVGGALYNTSHDPVPAYPNARYHIQKSQWEWGLNPTVKDHGSFMKELYLPIEKTNELLLPDGEWNIGTSVTMKVFNGHTPGMQLPLISNSYGTLFFAGDLIPVAAQTAVPFIMSFDVDPLRTAREKSTLLEKAAGEKWIFFFQHDVQIEAGYVEKGRKHFQLGDRFSLEEIPRS